MRTSTVAALLIIGGVLLAACGNSTTVASHVTKTSATLAEQPGAVPNYIFPLAPGQFYSAANVFQLQYLLYRPLYSFGTSGMVDLNNSLSLAAPPAYSNNGKSVTVTLKGWKWSDGVPITARDIQFWQNLVTADKTYWPAYVPGEYPDNVLTSTVSAANPLQITFTLDQAYGSYFFTYNELSQITPLPQHIWDRESATGPVGNFDLTPAGARAVYAFLELAVTECGHLQRQSALEGGVRALAAEVHGQHGQREDGAQPRVRGTGQADPARIRRGSLHPGERGVQPAQGGRLRRRHNRGFRLPACR